MGTPQEQQEIERLRKQWHQAQKQAVIDTQLGNAGRQQSQQQPNNQGCMGWNSPFARVDNKSGMPQLPEMRSINTAQSSPMQQQQYYQQQQQQQHQQQQQEHTKLLGFGSLMSVCSPQRRPM